MSADALPQLDIFERDLPPRSHTAGPSTAKEAEKAKRKSGSMGSGMYRAAWMVQHHPGKTIKELFEALDQDGATEYFTKLERQIEFQELRRRVSDCKVQKLISVFSVRRGKLDNRLAETYQITAAGNLAMKKYKSRLAQMKK
jgi:hypothetical protein